jgi:hypothetical protein
MNLTDGHVLKVGITLVIKAHPHSPELEELFHPADSGGHGGGGGDSDGAIQDSPLAGHEAIALNEAILILGDKTKDELEAPGGRAHAREQLSEAIKHAYHGDVTNVLLTNFVMS